MSRKDELDIIGTTELLTASGSYFQEFYTARAAIKNKMGRLPGIKPEHNEYLLAMLGAACADQVRIWPEVAAMLEQAQGMDWTKTVAVVDPRGGVDKITLRAFGSFEVLYAEMVEPWLGSWSDLREQYAKYAAGEVTREEGERRLREKAAEIMAAAKPMPAREIGKGKPGPGRAKTGAGGTRLPRGSNNLEYLAARLKRDHPEIAAKVAAGDYASIREAAVAAGIVKPPSPLAQMRSAWKRASPEQQATFRREIAG
jgi:hypothetical protein